MSRLQDRVAIVTGAAQGIGEAVARRFAAEGGLVVGIDRNAEKLETVCASLPRASSYALDVADERALGRCIREVTERHGRGRDPIIN